MEINDSEQFFDVMLDLLVDSKISRDEYDAITDYVCVLLDELGIYN